MGNKRVDAVRKRRKFLIKAAVLLVVACGLVFIVKHKKDMLVREGANFLQKVFSHETQLNVQIGKISGRLNGSIRFENVRIEDPALPAGLRLMFRAKEVEVRYRLVDFLTKKFGSKVRVSVTEPELYRRPGVSLRRGHFAFFPWLRDLALTQRSRIVLSVKGLKVFYGDDEHPLSDIQFDYEDDMFQARLPIRHWQIWGHDVSTQLNVSGKFESGVLGSPEALSGEVSTEGTVVNWGPLPWESRFDFRFSDQSLQVRSSELLGGLEMTCDIDFENDGPIRMKLLAHQYPLSSLRPFLRAEAQTALEGRLDLDARLEGDLDAPHLEIYARIAGGRSARNKFQAMDVHAAGVYPTMRLSDSHILLEDGSSMRFADKTVEFKDLFDGSLYEELISRADQDTVVIGDWEFKRPTDESQRPEFMMQRALGDNSRLRIKKFNEPSEEAFDSPDDHDVELGFEYRLKGRDSLKLEMREDERFVGIERKMSF